MGTGLELALGAGGTRTLVPTSEVVGSRIEDPSGEVWHFYLLRLGDEEGGPHWSERPVDVGDLVPFRGFAVRVERVENYDWSERWAGDPQGTRSSETRIFKVLHRRVDQAAFEADYA